MNRLFKICAFLMFPALALLYGCGDGDGHRETTDSVTTIATNADMVNDKDEEFVEDMLEDNAKAVAWLKAAGAKGTDAGLKKDAATMLSDHEDMDRRLRDLARNKSYVLDELNSGDSSIDAMDDKAGPNWDDDWADKMHDLHEKMTNRLNDYSDDVRDADLKAMINELMPKMNNHLTMSKALDERLHD